MTCETDACSRSKVRGFRNSAPRTSRFASRPSRFARQFSPVSLQPGSTIQVKTMTDDPDPILCPLRFPRCGKNHAFRCGCLNIEGSGKRVGVLMNEAGEVSIDGPARRHHRRTSDEPCRRLRLLRHKGRLVLGNRPTGAGL